jgi:hypothetical protein
MKFRQSFDQPERAVARCRHQRPVQAKIADVEDTKFSTLLAGPSTSYQTGDAKDPSDWKSRHWRGHNPLPLGMVLAAGES